MARMKTPRFHAGSVFLGLGVALLAVVAMGQRPVDIGGTLFRVDYGPHPRDMVVIREGTPYTVPAGRLFVLTALGAVSGDTGSSPPARTRFLVDGQDEIVGISKVAISDPAFSFPGGTGTSMQAVPLGFTAQAGSVLTVLFGPSGLTDARAWGYLAPQ